MVDFSINKRLNLVLQVERADKSVCHVHSVPVSYETYEANYTFLQKAMSSMYADEFSPATCSRIAFLRMRELAASDKDRFGASAEALLAEIWRLTNVLVPGDQGYTTLPFHDVTKGGVMSVEDIREVQNYICFFTAASHSHNQKEREGLYELLDRFGALTTSLDVTGFRDSLQTSKPVENTGEKAVASSIPH